MRLSYCASLRLAAIAVSFGVVGCAATRAETPRLADSCPLWAATSVGHGNAPSAGLGCTNALNLENMVADPIDLTTGKVLGFGDGAREALAVEAYKQGKVKALKQGDASATMVPVITTGASQ